MLIYENPIAMIAPENMIAVLIIETDHYKTPFRRQDARRSRKAGRSVSETARLQQEREFCNGLNISQSHQPIGDSWNFCGRVPRRFSRNSAKADADTTFTKILKRPLENFGKWVCANQYGSEFLL